MTEEKEMNEIELEKFIGYEKAFAELFKELGLKPAQCELIRAFLIVSKGQVEFEASFYDLAKVNRKTDGTDYKKLYDNARYAFEVLQKWQEENELALIVVKEKGHQENSFDDGKFTYHKTKYKFVLLAELAEAIAQNPENVESVIKETIIRLKECFVPAEKVKPYNPRHLMRKAKNTIFTKLKRVFYLAIQADDNPIAYCQRVLDDAWGILNDLEAEYKYSQNREKFITDFENELNIDLIEDLEEGEEF